MTAKRLKVRELPLSEQPLTRAQQYGLTALSNAELLQLVARFTYAGSAEELINKAGTLTQLKKMSVSEMTDVQDVGVGIGLAIHAAFELGRRQQLEERTAPQITCPNDAANLLMLEYGHKDQEHLAVMLLDTKNRVLAVETVYIGNVNSSIIRVSEVFKEAIKKNATAMIVCHNHPSGDPTPSPEDVHITRAIVEAGDLLGIEVLDHVIVGHNRWVSLKERGLSFS